MEAGRSTEAVAGARLPRDPGTASIPVPKPVSGQPAATIRVFLLDDHEIVRRGLADLLGTEPDIEVVGESASAQEAMRRIPALRPHVAILDGRLPDGSGVDVCRVVRSSFPEINALILTSYDDEDALFAAIMAGAAGYVLKQIRGTDLVRAVREIAAGRSLLDPAVTAKVLERVRTGSGEDPRVAALSDQERRIFDLVAEGLTNRQIAERMHLAEKTVKNYVSTMLHKLGFERRVQAAVFAGTLPHRACD
ncbi:response regulator [Embleya scabrispora]|uniref:response regulator n=1 Tax=Embleya scabrispora TaxID=159449 RepID=UPI00037A0A61|nr:response regulator transcription factor [Embleya scabrispora]MYS87860.1 response regulator [Streptomyces sp. SID5474]